MASLSAASMESYGRAYPMLTRLHALHELQTGFDLLGSGDSATGGGGGGGGSSARQLTSSTSLTTSPTTLSSLHWEDRLRHTAPSVPQRSTILAVRRAVLGICDKQSAVAENWLSLSTAMRQLGEYAQYVVFFVMFEMPVVYCGFRGEGLATGSPHVYIKHCSANVSQLCHLLP